MRLLCLALLASLPLRAQEPRPTVVLQGQVVDQRGEPVPLAKIAVHGDSKAVLGQGVADAEGRFRIAHVAESKTYHATAGAERFFGDTWTDRDDVPLRIVGHETASVRGTLRDRDGKPVANAMVQAATKRLQRDVLTDAITDADGRFELRAVTLGFVRLSAVVPGHGLAQARLVLGDDAEVALAPGKEVTTSLNIAVHGLPADALEKAKVRLYASHDNVGPLPPPWSEPTLDATGRCELRRIPVLRYVVVVSAPGFVFAPNHATIPALERPQLAEFSGIALGSAALQCPARLVDDADKPLAGVRLRLEAGSAHAEAITDADGRATFASPAAPGTPAVVTTVDHDWVLLVTEDGVPGLPWVRPGHSCTIDATTTMQLRAGPGCLVAGRVVLPSGKPAAHVEVELQRQPPHLSEWIAFDVTLTDADGRFRYAPKYRSEVRLAVTAPSGFATGVPLSIERPGTGITVPDLELSPPATIEGVVRDAEKRPAGGIRVWLLPGSLSPIAAAEVVTDRQGRYRFLGVPAGTVRLQLVAAELQPKGHETGPLDVEAGTTRTLDLQLAPR